MQVNYDDCRKIEAQITDFTISAYRGFSVIKLYQLKDWWLQKLAVYHKEYAKIGNRSIYTNTAENVLNDTISMILKYGTYFLTGIFILLKQTDISLGVQAIALSGSLFSGVISIFSTIPHLAVAKKAEARLSGWVNKKPVSAPENLNEILFSDVTKSIAEKTVLQNMTVSFAKNHIHIIKGANGSGKTTLFRLITGLLDCETGTIRIGNARPIDFSDAVFPEKLFYLPQEDADFPFTPCTLFEFADPKLFSDTLSIAKIFRLTEKQLYETNINELSGGERKKVHLSLAFASNPEWLLLDEPTNSLDAESKTVLLSLLKQRTGGTLLITHDPLFDKSGNYFYTFSKGALNLEKTNL